MESLSNDRQLPLKARYIMVGGFLGAGKTTAIGHLARHLTDRNYRVGLITNDQSRRLADTAILRSQGYTVEEVAGGCFCCRFDSLNQAAERLSVEERPDFFLAEPVGSCTDLIATVSYPLRRMYGDRFSIAPLTILMDCRRAARMFGLIDGPNFSSEVRYVYQKQIEEAGILLLNKIDLLDESLLARLQQFFQDQYPDTPLIPCSVKFETNLDFWFRLLERAQGRNGFPLDIDYERYARGEAALGWLNAALRLSSPSGIDGNELLTDLCGRIQSKLEASELQVAHLKMTLDPGFPGGEIALVSVVQNETVPELRASILAKVTTAQLILNLRAEASPQVLEKAVEQVIEHVDSDGLQLVIEDIECLRPPAPQPQYRISQETASNLPGRESE